MYCIPWQDSASKKARSEVTAPHTSRSGSILAVVCIGVAACTSIPGERESLALIATAEQRHGPNDEGMYSAVAHMALVYTTRGHHAKAVPYYERAVDIVRKNYAPDDIRRTVPMLQMAQAYDLDGQAAKADPLYDELLVQYQKQLARWESELARNQEKPKLLRTPAEQSRIAMAELFKPKPLSENINATVQILGMHGRYDDVAPLIGRIAWLRQKTER